ncbi:MAG: HAD-IIIC family phosphatase [Candidatus Sulfotelmatobacter sp.]
MRLGEALQIVGQTAGERQRHVHLVCGFMPLHLATFVSAYLKLRFSGDAISLHSGLYGDLEGNLERARQNIAEGAIVIIEWSDLDQRLGFRNSSRWDRQALDDVAAQIEEKCQRLEAHLSALAQDMPVTVVAPTLPLPPLTYVPPAQTSPFELRLDAILSDFLQRIGKTGGTKLLNDSSLAMISPRSGRHDIKTDLFAGYPYTLQHTDAVAQLSVSCLFAMASKKGLITDLDETLWKGILGDAGVEGISWSLEEKSQVHGLYQQVLASLAESGILIAIASKNDAKLVEAALQRRDMLLRPTQIFPVEAGWGAKSDAVGRILKSWNIGADSVVFVDDSAMELAEVGERYPGIECLQFPAQDPAGVLALLHQLRVRFGREKVGEEDQLRLESIRAGAQLAAENSKDASPDFLARLQARVTFENSGADHARAFELVNKTNQFNLNGVRYTEAEWKSRRERPGTFLTTIGYEDRFGPLGRIAVLGGTMEGDRCFVDVWVMSCRAFSRQIEFQVLRRLFATSGASAIRFQFNATERNGPLQKFFQNFFSAECMAQGELNLSAAVFEQACPPLFHEVVEK